MVWGGEDVGEDQPSGTSRGTNQTGVKLYNERLVLSMIRTHGPLSKVEISRMTGLSPQASSVIMKALEAEGLLVKGAPQRGKVGQPSVPMSLNPEGAFSLGFKVGRRSADLVLIDMVGTPRQTIRTSYAYPTPALVKAFVRRGVARIVDGMAPGQAARIRGFGIAAPSEMWSWEEEVGAPPDVVAGWRGFDLRAEIGDIVSWPVHACNDATAACAAELAYGEGRKYQDFLYVFFATLVGGGVVLDGSLYPGRRGYAGSIGSIPVPGPDGGAPMPLIRRASIYLLERMVADAGGDPASLWSGAGDWHHLEPLLGAWLDQAAAHLALAIGAAVSVIDFHNVVIDGSFPPHVRAALVVRTRERLAAMRMQGVAPVEIVEGKIGADARVLGAASLPLLAEYARDRDILFSTG
ncbi:ROK family transcriptional regulator [Ensifer soli]|uniref:ROK family transcriptional regulator n=1 Tax=Ciceribacter sp. sgz301302 TaxID=3342379 RepID=UPI0035B6C132